MTVRSGIGMWGWVVAAVWVCPAWGQGVIHVSTGGNDGNDGLSWETAKLTVQAGLNAAVSGDQVWVAAGTYREEIILKAGVGLYGGFAGGEMELSERGWRANETILDGSRVLVLSGATVTTRIDGFTIRNGSSGVNCSGSSPTIANNTIKGQREMYGSGIACDNSSPRLINNVVIGNSSTQGGGILCTNNSSPAILNNTIVGNNAPAGGIFCDDTSQPEITNTIIAFNSSGIRRSGVTPGSLTLRHNCVYGNAEGNYSGVTNPTGTEGNVSVDPKIAGWEYGNWHIQPDSPCVDAGDSAIGSGDFDVDGQARVWPEGGTVDIGADESDGTVWTGGPHVVVRVRPDGDDGNDGSDWSLAMRTVQVGVDVASTLGGEVWVAEGTYLERITLLPFAHLYGGFGGAETRRDQRDSRAHITILDGQRGGSVVTIPSGYAVSTIDGFTITNGRSSSGGGIYCRYASPTIRNNTITGNEAWHDVGGGIYCVSCCPMITDNTIVGNTASSNSSYGGGVFCYEASPTIRNNIIAENSGTRGGGLSLFTSSSVIADNVIRGNVASTGGGVWCNLSALTLVNNTIAGNRSTEEGGAGIACEDSAATIVQNRIMGNAAEGGGAGGIYCRGLIFTGYYPTIANNTITENQGGIRCVDSYATIVNTIIAFSGSGVSQTGTRQPTLRYTCVYRRPPHNYSGIEEPTVADGNITGDPKFVRTPGPGTDGVWGTEDDDYGDLRLRRGSACVDAGDNAKVPKDKADVDGDGNRAEQLPLDMAGRPRFVDDATADTGLGSPPIVDIGAYERRASVAADLDWDDDVDGFDFLTFANCYNGSDRAVPPGCASLESDLDGDGDVDGFDFLTFANCYNGSDRAALCE